MVDKTLADDVQHLVIFFHCVAETRFIERCCLIPAGKAYITGGNIEGSLIEIDVSEHRRRVDGLDLFNGELRRRNPKTAGGPLEDHLYRLGAHLDGLSLIVRHLHGDHEISPSGHINDIVGLEGKVNFDGRRTIATLAGHGAEGIGNRQFPMVDVVGRIHGRSQSQGGRIHLSYDRGLRCGFPA